MFDMFQDFAESVLGKVIYNKMGKTFNGCKQLPGKFQHFQKGKLKYML